MTIEHQCEWSGIGKYFGEAERNGQYMGKYIGELYKQTAPDKRPDLSFLVEEFSLNKVEMEIIAFELIKAIGDTGAEDAIEALVLLTSKTVGQRRIATYDGTVTQILLQHRDIAAQIVNKEPANKYVSQIVEEVRIQDNKEQEKLYAKRPMREVVIDSPEDFRSIAKERKQDIQQLTNQRTKRLADLLSSLIKE